MSDTYTCKSFKPARVRAIRTVSRETTLANVVVAEASVRWPPATSRDFRRRSLEANGNFVPVGENLERNPHVLHFLCNRICPKGVTVLLVESVSFCNRSRHFDSKFVRFLEEMIAPLFH